MIKSLAGAVLIGVSCLCAQSCSAVPGGAAAKVKPSEPDSLSSWPKDCRIRSKADSWEQLLIEARPSAVIGKSMLLWCTQDPNKGWTFELSQVF
jgi:hypothetical protein